MADRLNVPAPEGPKDETKPVAGALSEPGPGTLRLDVTKDAPAPEPKAEEPAKAPEPKAEEPKPADSKTPEKAEERLAASGLDLGTFSAEFAKDGKLSEESYAKLAEAGIDRATVDAYVEGQKARATALANDFAKLAGGEEKLAKVIEWAGKNLSDAEKAAYNEALDSGNDGRAKLALRGILAAYTEQNGMEPNLIEAAPAGQAKPAVAPFESRAQITAAMRDPRYKADPAYRAEVDRRLDVTSFGAFGRV